MYKVLVINVGSTSIKLGVFGDEGLIFKKTIGTGGRVKGVKEWLSFCRQIVDDILNRFDLIVSRGGLTRPLSSGAYLVNEAMCQDLREARYGWHPSNIGPLLAYEMGLRMGIRAIVFDSPVTNEMEPIARVSGLKEIERKAAFHVLNQKAAGRKAARQFSSSYEKMNLVIALYEENGILITALARKVALDKSTLTSLLDRLERDDLIQRVAHPSDRRMIQIYLPPKAEALREELIRTYNEVNSKFLSILTPEELRIFKGVLGKLERIGGKNDVSEEFFLSPLGLIS